MRSGNQSVFSLRNNHLIHSQRIFPKTQRLIKMQFIKYRMP